MFLLLSSAARPRYREDILRCVAAPVGGTIQFRYQKRWIACDSMKSLNGKDGLVCFMGEAENGHQPLTPVRYVTIEHVSLHGTTVSLILKMRDFAFAQTEGFSNQVASCAGVHHPRKENGKLDGRWLFSVEGANLSGIEHSKSLATWEKLVQELASKPEFANEGFYWTVVGVEPIAQLNTDYSDSVTWPTALCRNSSNSLLIYHYSPSPETSLQEAPVLTFSCGGSIHNISSTAVRIDSRYDLKRWRFKAQSTGYGPEPGWIGITAPAGWGLELPLGTKRAIFAPAGLGVLIGLLLGLGGAGAAMRDVSSIDDPKLVPAIIVAGFSLAGGVLAGLAAVFGIRKSV
jgi:hypothetical protein